MINSKQIYIILMNIVKYQKKDERTNKQERYQRFNNNPFK